MLDYNESIYDGKKTSWLRPKTTRRYLQPPKSDRLFVLWSEGKVLFGENILGEDWHYYKTIESCVFWPTIGNHYRGMNFKKAVLTKTESGAPIHGMIFHKGAFQIEEEALTETSAHPTCFIRFRITNTASFPISEKFNFLIRRGKEYDMIYGESDGYVSYDPEVAAVKLLPSTFTCDEKKDGQTQPGLGQKVAKNGEYFLTAEYRVPPKKEEVLKSENLLWYDEENGAFRTHLTLLEGESVELVFSFGKGEVKPFSYEEEKKKTEAFWEKELARITKLPKAITEDEETYRMIRHLVAQMLQCYCFYVDREDLLVLRQGGLQRLIWPWDALPALELLGRIGDFSEELEEVFHTYLNVMQQESGEIRNFGEAWGAITGCCLYSICTYCLQKNDPEYWLKNRDRILHAFHWLENERAKSENIEGAIPGLLPPLRASDWYEVFQHWTFTDTLTVTGYRALVRAAESFDDPAKEEIRAAFDDYRQVLLTILQKVPGYEGTQPFRIPLLPDRDDTELLNQFYPYMQHAELILQLHDLIPETVFERVRIWAEKVGMIENGLYGRMPATDGNCHIFYTTAPEYDWFFEYLLRGEREKAREIIESTIKYSMTDEYYMIERYDSEDPYFVPWSPNISAAGRFLNMLLDFYGGKTNWY